MTVLWLAAAQIDEDLLLDVPERTYAYGGTGFGTAEGNGDKPPRIHAEIIRLQEIIILQTNKLYKQLQET